MTAALELPGGAAAPALEPPLPGDWSRARLLGCGLLAQAALLLVAVRHRWFYVSAWLGLGEALGLLLATALGGIAMARTLRQAGSLPLSFVVRGGLLLTLAAAVVPPFLSTDLFDYLSRGQLERLGYNPYLTAVADVADARLQPFAELSEWTPWRMPYGPLMALLQWLLAFLPWPWLGVCAWKLLAAAAHVGAGWLFYRTLALDGDRRAAQRGLVLWLWNPLLLLEGVVDAHNDIVIALLLLLLAFAAARDRFALAALAFGGALLLKHAIAPVGVLLLALAWRRRRLPAFALGTAAVAAVAALLWLRYFTEPAARDFVWRQAEVARASLYALLAATAGLPAARAEQILAALVLLLCLLIGVRRLRDAHGFGGAAVLLLAWLLLLAPQFVPWYHLWWLPLVALAPRPAALRVFELLAWFGPLSYLVHAGTHKFGALHQAWQFALAALWPLSLLLLEARALLPRPAPPAAPAP